jgi:hypothetical protein
MTVRSFLTLLLPLLTLTAGTSSAQAIPAGHVRGTIFDSNKAVVTNVRVTFEALGEKRETVTNWEGHYDIELPIGTYQITTHAQGFSDYLRAPFRVESSSSTTINATLVVCSLAHFLKIDKEGKYIGEEAHCLDPFKSESFYPNSSGLGLLIRYGNRRKGPDIVEYGGVPVTNGIPSGVTITYDLLTIVADKVSLNTKTYQLEADGNVTIEDGNQTLTMRNAKVDFRARDPLSFLRGKH